MGGLVLTTTSALGASVLAAGPEQPAVPQRASLAAAPAATVTPVTAEQARISKQQKRADDAVKYAAGQIGDRYRYGATGPGSWDCSGLAGGSWSKAGVKLPRTTQQIYKAVHKKVSWKGLVKGDLLFFYGGRTHMGVYAGHGYMIHAPSSGKRVKKIKLNGYYKRSFHGAVRPGI